MYRYTPRIGRRRGARGGGGKRGGECSGTCERRLGDHLGLTPIHIYYIYIGTVVSYTCNERSSFKPLAVLGSQ